MYSIQTVFRFIRMVRLLFFCNKCPSILRRVGTSDMGSYLTYLWWGGDPDIPDAVSGMSTRDIYNVQKTWAPIYAKSSANGMELFLRFFRKDPNAQDFFKNIQGMSEEEISRTVVFQAHVQTLMASLNTAIVNLQEPAVVVALMNKLGMMHQTRHIQKKHFEELKEVIVDFLVNDLKLGDQQIGSWSRFVTFIYRHIFERLKD